MAQLPKAIRNLGRQPLHDEGDREPKPTSGLKIRSRHTHRKHSQGSSMNCDCTAFLSAVLQFIAPVKKTSGIHLWHPQDAPRVSAVRTPFQVVTSPELTT